VLPRAAQSPATAAAPEPTSAEAAAFARALQKLRQDRDPRAALRLLDDHDRLYPRGRLSGEATLARIEAHLVLADASGALRVLDDAHMDTLPRATEARVLRGELRSDAGRCGDAVQDFTAVVAGAAAPAIRERALHGRALCLARLAQTEAARADARLYMSQFPHGRFAAEMHRAAEGEDPR
jgi:hypothetical protein